MKTIEILLKVYQTVEVPDEYAGTVMDIEEYLTNNNKWPSVDLNCQEWTQEVIR